ncbi:MAG: hypothetical protein ACKO37_10030 [Vampirovibrionales bacterium]
MSSSKYQQVPKSPKVKDAQKQQYMRDLVNGGACAMPELWQKNMILL